MTEKMMDVELVTSVIALGDMQGMVEDHFPNVDPDTGVKFVENLAEYSPSGDYKNQVKQIVGAVAAELKRGSVLLICAKPSREDARVIRKLQKFADARIFDEGLMRLMRTEVKAVGSPLEFEDAIFDAMERFEVEKTRIEFLDGDDENEVLIHPPYRQSQTHSIRWCPDGVVEIDGVIVRHTAIMCQGHMKHDLLGQKVLTPNEVVGFIAQRLAIAGLEELVGYGRAFGPTKDDQANASLTEEGRKFRANGVVGVVTNIYQTAMRGEELKTIETVTKAHPEMVGEVARKLRKLFPDEFLIPHQQMKELYFGEAAVRAFRARKNEEEGKPTTWTLFAKHSKGARVDAGAYCLHTEDGTGMITMPAIIGAFEESNDGMGYAPKALMDKTGGFLRESVTATRDCSQISDDLKARYFDVTMHVKPGDEIEPGDLLFTVSGVEHHWDSKADFGFVTSAYDGMDSDVAQVSVDVEAWFAGDLKGRGPVKMLVAPSEACGITARIKGDRKPVDRLIIGAAGCIKDSAAAKEYITNAKTVTAIVTTEFCERDYELHKQKHMPAPKGRSKTKWEKAYANLGVTMEWDDTRMTVTTTDTRAIACDLKLLVEAAPVAQSVGTAGMTMPQMAWLSSLPTGNEWLKQQVLPGVIKRANALAYLHAVANRVPAESRV